MQNSNPRLKEQTVQHALHRINLRHWGHNPMHVFSRPHVFDGAHSQESVVRIAAWGPTTSQLKSYTFFLGVKPTEDNGTYL